MKLWDDKEWVVECKCINPNSFEPTSTRDEEGEVTQYQCLVCGVIVDGKYWAE